MNFRTHAKEMSSLSPVMDGKEVVKVEDIINRELVIEEIDLITVTDTFSGEKQPKWVCAINDKEFIFAPTILNNTLNSFLEEYDGDVGTFTSEYVNSSDLDKIHLIFVNGKTRDGQKCYKIEWL